MNGILKELNDKLYAPGQEIHPRSFVSTVDAVYQQVVASKLTSTDDFNAAARLLTDYGVHLANLGTFARSVEVLTFVIQMYANNKGSHGKHLVNEPLVEKALLYRGVAHYKLRAFKLASIDLGTLTNAFPANAKYKNWYNKSVTAGLKIIQGVVIVLFVLAAIGYFMSRHDPGTLSSLSYSLMVGFLICIIVVDFIKRRRKKK